MKTRFSNPYTTDGIVENYKNISNFRLKNTYQKRKDTNGEDYLIFRIQQKIGISIIINDNNKVIANIGKIDESTQFPNHECIWLDLINPSFKEDCT